MRLRYSPEAREDLRNLRQYIAVELCNPSAADSVVESILRSCSVLKAQPDMGVSLSEKIGRDTKIQYIISGKHLAFYLVEEECVSIIRILDSRTNYMQKIFG